MASRWAFRYQTLLRVRELREEQASLRLGEVRNAIQRAAEERDSIESERGFILRQAAETASGVFVAGDVGLYYAYERHLAKRRLDKEAELAGLREDEEARRRELEIITKDKRVVERLKERHVEMVRGEINKLEQKAADEAAACRIMRSPRGRNIG